MPTMHGCDNSQEMLSNNVHNDNVAIRERLELLTVLCRKQQNEDVVIKYARASK